MTLLKAMSWLWAFAWCSAVPVFGIDTAWLIIVCNLVGIAGFAVVNLRLPRYGSTLTIVILAEIPFVGMALLPACHNEQAGAELTVRLICFGSAMIACLLMSSVSRDALDKDVDLDKKGMLMRRGLAGMIQGDKPSNEQEMWPRKQEGGNGSHNQNTVCPSVKKYDDITTQYGGGAG